MKYLLYSVGSALLGFLCIWRAFQHMPLDQADPLFTVFGLLAFAFVIVAIYCLLKALASYVKKRSTRKLFPMTEAKRGTAN